MRNPLTKIFLNSIEDRFKRNTDPVEKYDWEDYKRDFKKHTGHDFDSLKNGSFIKARYLYSKHLYKNRQKINNFYYKFEVERSKYHDENGVLIDEKWKELIDYRNKKMEEDLQVDYMTSFKDEYDCTDVKITGAYNETLTKLFRELDTYQTKIQVYEDEESKKIKILVVDYNPDIYSPADALLFHSGKLYTISDRYWPKDKYSEMEEAAKYFKDRKIENTTYFPNVIDKFPCAVGTEQWIKHYFNKLPEKEVLKFRDYSFRVNFTIFSPITGFGGDDAPDYFVDGKINWD